MLGGMSRCNVYLPHIWDHQRLNHHYRHYPYPHVLLVSTGGSHPNRSSNIFPVELTATSHPGLPQELGGAGHPTAWLDATQHWAKQWATRLGCPWWDPASDKPLMTGWLWDILWISMDNYGSYLMVNGIFTVNGIFYGYQWLNMERHSD